MKRSFSLLLVLLLVCTSLVKVNAQITAEDIKTQMVKDWERAKAYTNDYLTTMPADKYSARAVDSIRSFAEQMLHLASGNIGLSATGVRKVFRNRQSF